MYRAPPREQTDRPIRPAQAWAHWAFACTTLFVAAALRLWVCEEYYVDDDPWGTTFHYGQASVRARDLSLVMVGLAPATTVVASILRGRLFPLAGWLVWMVGTGVLLSCASRTTCQEGMEAWDWDPCIPAYRVR